MFHSGKPCLGKQPIAIDANKVVAVAFVDFRKAFDCLCHAILLRHGQKSWTSHSLRLTLGPFDNALTAVFQLRDGSYFTTNRVVGHVVVLYEIKTLWLKVLPKLATEKDF